MPLRISARAWCRVDLAGGTLDIWPLGLLHAGSRTVNVAIDTAARVEVERLDRGYRVRQGESVVEADSAAALSLRPEAALIGLIIDHLGLPPVEVRLASESPRGAGLGASSALAVATLAAGEALLGREDSSAEIRSAVARDLEARLMGLPTGRQDHYPALLGGALELVFLPGGERVRRLETDLEALGRCLLVAYTGESHLSADTNWRVIRRRLDAEPEVVRAFEAIAAAAAAITAPLEAGDLREVGRLMSREWRHRRRLAPEVATPRIDELLGAALEAGAWGGKVCGAGGGGSIAVLCPALEKERIAESLRGRGARILATAPISLPMAVEVRPD